MPQQRRVPSNVANSTGIGTGPYLARIVNHLDSTFMGSLEVTLLRYQGNSNGEDTQTFIVRCAQPFFGYTPFEYMGFNDASKKTLDGFNDTQKSYGMWFVPPDIGVTVIVIFIDGDPTQGYWIGCVPASFTNNMVPAIGGSKNVDLDPTDKKKYNTQQPLPIAEINRRLNTKVDEVDPEKYKRVVHPIADRFLEQGTLEDDIRGVTTSTSRREVPSMVFGISTPGPRDKRPGAKKEVIGAKKYETKNTVPVSRLGGTQFVMDDGDERFQRKTPAKDGPVDYADTLNNEKGDPTIPYNEYFRVRTRTGHQLLMHNSEDLIYIGNARGTTWIELTSNGKIDIFAEDSVSIHTKNDFNVRADRDINLEAGRNVNIKATAQYQSPTKLYEDKKPFDAAEMENGRVYIESVQNMDLLIGRNGKIHVRNDEKVQGNFDIKVMGNMRISVQDKDVSPSFTNVGEKKILAEQPEGVKGLHIYSNENTRIYTKKNVDILTDGNVKVKTGGKLDINTTGNNSFTTGGNTNINSSKNHIETASRIDMNGPTADTAEVAEKAEIADKVRVLPLRDNPITDKDLEWAKTKYKVVGKALTSLMTRIPMHEPWAFHENFTPKTFTPSNTDREA